jgi:membrane protease YdiL (CAAX protease family)
MAEADRGAQRSPISLLAVGVFYSVLFLVALVWDHFRRLILIPRSEEIDAWGLLWHAFLAVALAAAVITGCWQGARRWGLLRRIALEFRSFLYPLDLHAIFLLSLFSAVGEEFFFRGVVQGEVGLVAASFLFGLMHVGPRKHYLVWTGFAIAIGFMLGWLYLYTGNILAPALAHFLINGVNLYLLRFVRGEAAAPPPEAA